MRKVAIGLVWLGMLMAGLLHAADASALEIGCPPQSGNCSRTVLWVSGEIVRGDLHRLADALVQGGGEISTIVLFNMRGGDLNEAIRIGRLIHRLRIETSVGFPIYGEGGSLLGDFSDRVYYPLAAASDQLFPVPSLPQDQSFCVSACIVVWAGGYERFGVAFLFAHRMSIRPGDGATTDRLRTSYETAEEVLADYFEEMNASAEFIHYLRSMESSRPELMSPAAIDNYFGARDVLNDTRMLWACGGTFPAWSDVANLRPAPEIFAQLAACHAARTAADRRAAWQIVFGR